MNESIFFERWFDESYELDLPEIINQIIKYSTNDSFPHPRFISFQFYFWSYMTHEILLIDENLIRKYLVSCTSVVILVSMDHTVMQSYLWISLEIRDDPQETTLI